MDISFRIRRRRTVAGAAVLALALGGLAAALPAQASAPPAGTASPDLVGGASASGNSIPIGGGSPPHGTPVPVIQPVITDSLNPGGVTAPDAILTCATSQLAIGGTQAVAVPVGCLTLYNGEWVKVTWTGGTGVSTELNQQTDGNLVLTPGNGVTPWASGTTFKGNAGGPGCLAQFQSSANLVVSNCDGVLIWNSATKTYPNAVLAFQMDGNLVIYETSAGTALWSSKT